MGFQGMIRGCSEGQYHKLHKDDEEVVRPRRQWLRKVNGKAISFRLSSPSKRLKWMRFSIIMLPRWLSEFYAEALSTMRVDAVYPTINFSFQWGLPSLSHPSVITRKRPVVSLRRKISPWK